MQEVKVTYIGHSGFMVETGNCCLWFDVIAQEEKDREEKAYAAGEMPVIPKDKPLVVFASHAHHDHYCEKIWELRRQYPDVFYVLSKAIPLSAGYRARLGLTEADMEKVQRVMWNRTYELPQLHMKVETLKSTDQGVAFYVTVDGISIYHAGDLHAWYWLEEGEDYVAQMHRNFEAQLSCLKGRKTDIAFLLLDDRLGETTYEGMDRYLETMEVSYTFPMHLWKKYGLIDEYKKAREGRIYSKSIQTIHRENEAFSIMV